MQTVGKPESAPVKPKEKSISPRALPSLEAETERVMKPALPQPLGPNSGQHSSPSADATPTERCAPPVGGAAATGTPRSANENPAFTKGNPMPVNSVKSHETSQNQYQEPSTGSRGTPSSIGAITLSVEDKSPLAKHPRITSDYHQLRKRRIRLNDGVDTADERFCGFGSYFACTQGLCRRLCY
jgi:hypothetical protein